MLERFCYTGTAQFSRLRRSCGLLAAAACCWSFATGTSLAQGVSQRSFEVASVKRAGDSFSTAPRRSGGRFTWTTQLAYLIGYAYGLDPSKVSSASQRIGTVYSVDAIFDASATDEEVRSMTKALLAERFQLKAHVAVSTADGYAVVISKKGLKVRKSDAGADAESSAVFTVPRKGIIALVFQNGTMAQLAEGLARSLQVPVWDQTGLMDKYSFSLEFATDQQNDAPWVGTALSEAVGVELEKRRGPVEKLVVDWVEEPAMN